MAAHLLKTPVHCLPYFSWVYAVPKITIIKGVFGLIDKLAIIPPLKTNIQLWFGWAIENKRAEKALERVLMQSLSGTGFPQQALRRFEY